MTRRVPRLAYVVELWIFLMGFVGAAKSGHAVIGTVIAVPLVLLGVRGLMDPPASASKRVLDVLPHAVAAFIGCIVIVYFVVWLPRDVRRAEARRYARQLEAQFKTDPRFVHVRVTDYHKHGVSLAVSGQVREGDLSALKKAVEARSPVEHVEYAVAEMDPAKYELAEAQGKLTQRRDMPHKDPAASSDLRTQPFFDLVVSGYLTADERQRGRRVSGMFDADRIVAWPLDALGAWLPGDSLVFDDTNLMPSARTFTQAEVLKQLKDRKGPLHEALAHIAFLRTAKDVYFTDKPDSDPLVQRIRMFAGKYDSKLVERVEGDRVIAELGESDRQPTYRLTFIEMNERLTLTKIEYTQLEEDCRDPDAIGTDSATTKEEAR